MSPLLFNLVVDQALSKIADDIGYDLVGARVNALAFADDVILCASTVRGLQVNLDMFTSELSRFGLEVNVTKSCAVAMAASGRDKKIKLITKNLFKVNGSELPSHSTSDVWKYLGIQFEGTKTKSGPSSLGQELQWISKAPLRPQQRLNILRTYLLPRHFHAWVLGRTTAGSLRALDITVREAVRNWLRLPKDVPTAYFHARVKDGGLGIPLLGLVIPIMRLIRFRKLEDSNSPAARAAFSTELVQRQLKWCVQIAKLEGRPLDTHSGMADALRDWLHSSCDGFALRESHRVPASTWWVARGSAGVPARDYVQYHRVRVNCLPTRSRVMRGARRVAGQGGGTAGPHPAVAKLCRAGCGVPETAAHVVQQCVRTHVGRIERHNAVARVVTEALKKQGWRTTEEPSLKTSLGTRKPDIIAASDSRVVVIDAQVVSAVGQSLGDAHQTKVRKYADIPGILEVLSAKYDIPPDKVEFTTVTLSWQGVWCSQSYESLMQLRVPESCLRRLPTMVLQGSHTNWTRFNRTTTVLRGHL